MTRRTILFLIVCAAVLALSAVFYIKVWNEAPVLQSDSHEYIRIADDLVDFKLEEMPGRSIVYPLALRLAGFEGVPGRRLFYLQLVLHYICVVLLGYLLFRSFISQWLTFLFLLLSILPSSIVTSAYVLTESLAQFFLVAGFATLCLWLADGRRHWLLLGGICLALAAVTRPTFLALFPFIAAVLFLLVRIFPPFAKRFAIAALTVFLLTIVFIGAANLSNYRSFGYAGISSKTGLHLSNKTLRYIERLPDEYDNIKEILIKYRDERLTDPESDHLGYDYVIRAEKKLCEATGLEPAELSKYLTRMNIELIKRAPLLYLQDVGFAMTTYWFPYSTKLSNFDSRFVQMISGALHFVIIAFFFVLSLLFICFAVPILFSQAIVRKNMIRLIENGRLRFITAALALAIIIYSAVVSSAFQVGTQRYRTPTDLLIFFVMIVMLDSVIRARRDLDFEVTQKSVAEDQSLNL
jgi:4-amino-4-deoxy-L-arabinose transferase-like glycosyltransferase